MVIEKIKMLMKQKHITLVSVAEYLGISPQSLSNKIRRNSLSIQELIVILDCLDCNLVIESKPDTRITLTLDD